jgi:hypothetical protein
VLGAHPSEYLAVPRRARGKPDVPPPPAPAKRRDESVTTRLEVTPDLLASMLVDDSERPTVRIPVRPPFATTEDEELARQQKVTDVTVRKRMIIGPDGQPRMFDPDELDEPTHVGPPPKVLLAQTRAPKKRTKR